MTHLNAVKAALLGFAVVLSYVAAPATAQDIQVVRKGAAQDLKVNMNRAVVVESDVPFAELSIANPAIADFSTLSDRTIYVLGKAPGRTTLTLLDPTGRLITNVEVHVSPDVSEFKERLQQILPGEKIEVRSANDGIVLSGTVSSIVKMDRAIDLAQRYAPERVSNLMSVSGKQQVMLKVRFAEMQRTISKSLGTSFFFDGLDSGLLGGSASTGSTLSPNVTIDSTNGTIAGLDPSTQGAAFFGLNIGSAQLGVLLEAMEQKGIVRTLAEPNLTALSGQEARFLAGGELPIPVISDDGVGIEYTPFGVELDFIPRVNEDNVINLELGAAVRSLDPANGVIANGFNIDAFTTRQAESTVVLRDGQSFAIAGLLQDDFTDLNNQVPWLGDIPVLGALFRSASYTRGQTELVIIITAHLVSPTSGAAFALPTDRVKLPTEKDLFLNGRVAIDKRGGAGGEVARQDFDGSYGYILD
ncbi:MAG: type II and III secretion system protein family protein [Pseudomonadota bacterium]